MDGIADMDTQRVREKRRQGHALLDIFRGDQHGVRLRPPMMIIIRARGRYADHDSARHRR
jgi:hypothetical protein